MTSLMKVTLLLVQNEADLINANMYVTCSLFVLSLIIAFQSIQGSIAYILYAYSSVEHMEPLIEMHGFYAMLDADNIVSVFQRGLPQ